MISNVQAIMIALGLGVLTYCIYFDRKRRNAPDYQDKVRARREKERQAREKDEEIKLPSPDDKTAIDKFFVNEIEIGEGLMQAGEIDKAVKHLSYAVVFCPQPQQLLSYLKEVLPTTAYAKLVDSVEVAGKRVSETYKKSSLQEDEVE